MSSSAKLMGSIDECKELYKKHQFAILDEEIFSSVERQVIKAKCAVSRDYVHREGVGSQGEMAKYLLLDANGTEKVAPQLFYRYDRMVGYASEIIGKELVKSPHWRSSINIRVYMTGDTEGLHYDTNPMSVLVFLAEGAPLQIEIDGEMTDIDPAPGKMAVFNGKTMLHRVPKVDYEQFRITSPVNVYFPGETDRPAWIDRLCYDNMSYEDATREEVP